MARFVIETPGQPKLLYELVKPRVTIGRSERNDLALNDANASRLHAIVELTPGGYRISDQSSRNGIFVNGRRCPDGILANGAQVRVGDSLLRFEDTTAAWSSTSLVARSDPGTHLMAAASESALVQATHAFHRLAAEPRLPGGTSDLQAQLHEAKRRALLFELVTHARRVMQDVTDPSAVLATIPRLVFSATGAERVLVMLWDEKKQCLQPADIHTAPGTKLRDTEVALSQTLLNAVLQSRKAVLVRDANVDSALMQRQSVALSGLRSAICVPMTAQARLYGLVYADNCHRPLVFDDDDVEVVSILALEAALALDSARGREQLLEEERIRQAYRRYLPEHLADQLIAKPDSVRLGGERRFITALFADLRGFTSLSEVLAPEEAVELLNAFFTEMTAIIFRHNGTLDKYLGDGLLAVFGAPVSDSSDALRAVQCAIAMQAALDEMASDCQVHGRPLIPMGIGVNSGEAIAGNIGSAQYMEYTVIGDTVNVAARLTQHAGPGEILLGEATWHQVESHVPAELLGALRLKGKREAVPVYRVSRAASAAAGR